MFLLPEFSHEEPDTFSRRVTAVIVRHFTGPLGALVIALGMADLLARQLRAVLAPSWFLGSFVLSRWLRGWRLPGEPSP